MKIILDATIDIYKAKDETYASLMDTFEYQNPDYFRAQRLLENGAIGRTELPPKYERCFEVHDDHLSVGIANLETVVKFGRVHKELIQIIDKRSRGRKIDFSLDLGGKVKYLEPYQTRIIKAAEEHVTCCASGPTGSGKTLTGIGFIAKHKMSTLILVDRRDLLVQWVSDIEENAVGNFTIGQIGDKKKKWGDVTVAMVQSLKNLSAEEREKVKRDFGIMLVDEVHKASAPTFTVGTTMFSTYYKIGLSATPKRKDKKEFIFKNYIGEVKIEVDDQEVIDEGRIVPVQVKFVDTGYRLDYDEIGRDITRFPVEALSDDERNQRIIYEVERDLELGFMPIVFSNRVVHCNHIFGQLKSRGWKVALLTGKVDKRIRDEMKDRAKRGELEILVANPQIMDTGINIPPLSSAHIPFFTSNEVMLKQISGRIRRSYEGKEFAKMVYYRDDIYIKERDKRTGDMIETRSETFKRAYASVRRLFKKWGFQDYVEPNEANVQTSFNLREHKNEQA